MSSILKTTEPRLNNWVTIDNGPALQLTIDLFKELEQGLKFALPILIITDLNPLSKCYQRGWPKTSFFYGQV